MSCAQLAAEMGEIMNKRDMKHGIALSKSKICASTKVLNKQGEERRQLSAAQQPALISASVVGGPAANAVFSKTQAEDAALEAKQQPERNRALAGLGSGMGDMLGVMNDPRLMRLMLLAQDKQCAESMAPSSRRMPRFKVMVAKTLRQMPMFATHTRPLALPIHSFNAVRRLQSPRLRIPLRSAELFVSEQPTNKTFVTAVLASGVARIGTPCGR